MSGREALAADLRETEERLRSMRYYADTSVGRLLAIIDHERAEAAAASEALPSVEEMARALHGANVSDGIVCDDSGLSSQHRDHAASVIDALRAARASDGGR